MRWRSWLASGTANSKDKIRVKSNGAESSLTEQDSHGRLPGKFFSYAVDEDTLKIALIMKKNAQSRDWAFPVD